MKRYIVEFKDSYEEGVLEKYKGVLVDSINGIDNLAIFDVPKGTDIKKISNDPKIKSIEEDSEVETSALDPLPIEYSESESYFVRKLKLRDYWKRGIDGTGINVAILDSGIFNHRDLNIAGGLNGYDENLSPTLAAYFHGTHVAGIVASQHNNKGGYIGAAPGVNLYSLKCDNNSGGSGLSNAAIIRCANWCIENNIHIMNCSFSGTSSAANSSLVAAANAGIIVTAATGNSGNSTVGLPARLPEIIGVGNAAVTGEKYGTSNYGEGIDMVAFGASIIAPTNIQNSYRNSTGTSMASPLAASVFALYMQLFPNMTSAEIIQKVYDNCRNVDGSEYNLETGRGLPYPPDELYSRPVTVASPKRVKVAHGYGPNLVAPVNGIQRWNGTSYDQVQMKVYVNYQFI